MSEVISLAAERAKRSQAALPVELTDILRDPEDRVPVDPEYLSFVTEGVDRIMRMMRCIPRAVRAAEEGYEMREAFGRPPAFLAGPEGMEDFRGSFLCVNYSQSDPEIERASGIAYGVYGAAKLMLPVVVSFEVARERILIQSVHNYNKQAGKVSAVEARDEIFGWVAARLALYTIQEDLDPDYANLLDAITTQTGLPLENQEISNHFMALVDDKLALRLIGR